MSPLDDDRSLASKDFWEGFWNRPGQRRFGQFQLRFLRPQAASAGGGHRGRPSSNSAAADPSGCRFEVARGVNMWGVDYSDRGLICSAPSLKPLVQGDSVSASLRARCRRPRSTRSSVLACSSTFPTPGRSSNGRRARQTRRRHSLACSEPRRRVGCAPAEDRSPRIYDVHRVYDPAMLDRVYVAGGLEVLNLPGMRAALPRSSSTTRRG